MEFWLSATGAPAAVVILFLLFYKQKRRTRATIAKEKGLEPLAELVWQQEIVALDDEAANYISEENELHTIEDVVLRLFKITGLDEIMDLRASIRGGSE